MTNKALFLLLRKQVTQKWGRFLLASGGIMIGIWAITLTSSLSLGLSDTIVEAINSQAVAKEIRLYKTPTNQTNFFDIQEAPKFVPLSISELDQIKKDVPNIKDIVPSELLAFYYPKNSDLSCVQANLEIQENSKPFANQNDIPAQSSIPPSSSISNSLGSSSSLSTSAQSSQNVSSVSQERSIGNAQIQALEFVKNCPSINIASNIFDYFYETNKSNWVGQTTAPKKGEIVVCFKCGSQNFYENIPNAQIPEDLLNKEIELEFKQSPNAFEKGKVQDVLGFQTDTEIKTSQKTKLKIVAVVDDREGSTFSTSGNLNFYVDFEYFLEAITIKNPTLNIDSVGFIENLVVVNSYDKVDQVIKDLQSKKYLAFSLTQALIAGVQSAFGVLTAVLAGFGFIALIASIFGIINVMTISVLERKKEIGILKSLGARDGDIFKIFFLESSFLGVLGWALGTLVSFGFGALISLIFRAVIDSNQSWKDSLGDLNITEFAPIFPWWLLLGTLIIAIFFTAVSGIFPALRASRQNPVDVLRSE